MSRWQRENRANSGNKETGGSQTRPYEIRQIQMHTARNGCATSADFLADGFGLGEEEEIIGAAGFGIGAGHIESAERMRADHGSGAFAIDVKIADVKFVLGAVDFFGRLGVDGAGEAVVGIVG